jgi:hypothetical protein
METAERLRWRALEVEMKAYSIYALLPTAIKATTEEEVRALHAALAYACGLQGDVSEAKALAASITGVVKTGQEKVFVCTGLSDLTEEMVDNLIQAFSEAASIAPHDVHVVREDSSTWKANSK